jgi:hypothetical protein
MRKYRATGAGSLSKFLNDTVFASCPEGASFSFSTIRLVTLFHLTVPIQNAAPNATPNNMVIAIVSLSQRDMIVGSFLLINLSEAKNSAFSVTTVQARPPHGVGDPSFR